MGVSSFFKNLFGKPKDSDVQTESTSEQTEEAAISYSFIEKAETLTDQTFIKIKEVSEPILEDAVEYASQAKDIISEYVEKTTDTINDIIDSVKEINTEDEDSKRVVYDTVIDDSEKAITLDE